MKKRFAAILVLSVLFMQLLQAFGASPATEEEFTDVKPGTWYYNDVMQAQKAGYVVGVGQGKYSPQGTVTYGQFLTIISRLRDSSVDQQPASNPWYSKYVDSTRNLGVISKSEAINALANIPRQDMIKYTCKALGVEPYTGNDIIFKDVKPEDAAYINAAYQHYLTEGNGGYYFNGTLKFGWNTTSTRAELATMANRLAEYIKDPAAYEAKHAEARAASEKAAQQKADQANTITFNGYKIPKDFTYYDKDSGIDFYGFVRWQSAPEGFTTMQSILSSKWDAAIVKQAIDYGKTRQKGVTLPYKDFDTGKGYQITVSSAPNDISVTFEVIKIQAD